MNFLQKLFHRPKYDPNVPPLKKSPELKRIDKKVMKEKL